MDTGLKDDDLSEPEFWTMLVLTMVYLVGGAALCYYIGVVTAA